MNLQNNSILITGGGSGFGLALAKKMSLLGNKIILVGRDKNKLEAAILEVKNAEYLICDITNKIDLDSLILRVEQEFPEINILINNAGIQNQIDFIVEQSIFEKVKKEINVNFLAPVYLTSLMLPTLLQHNESAIINISSGLGIYPKPTVPIYSASKAALSSFSISLRYQLEETKIKVFECVPPVMKTKMSENREIIIREVDYIAQKCITSIAKDEYEILIGKIKLMKILGRFFPKFIKKKVRYSK